MRATVIYGARHVRVENVRDPVIKQPTTLVRIVRGWACDQEEGVR